MSSDSQYIKSINCQKNWLPKIPSASRNLFHYQKKVSNYIQYLVVNHSNTQLVSMTGKSTFFHILSIMPSKNKTTADWNQIIICCICWLFFIKKAHTERIAADCFQQSTTLGIDRMFIKQQKERQDGVTKR